MRCGDAGNPPPRESIAGRDGDGRGQAANRRSKTTEESLLRRFGHFQLGDPRTPPWCGANPRRGNRLPGSIAGWDGDWRLQPPNRRSKAAEESLLRRFGRFGLGDRGISPCCTAKRRGGRPASPVVHRRSGRRWTQAATQKTVRNGGGQYPPSFRTLGAPGSANLPVLRCEKARWHPPRVSIAGREGDGRLRPPNPRSKTAEESLLRRFGRFGLGDRRISPCCAAKRRGGGPTTPGVYRRSGGQWTTSATPPTVQNGGRESPPPFWTLGARGSANPPVLRCEKARWHPPPRVSIAGREGDGRLRPPNPQSKTAEESLLRRFRCFALGDRGIPPCWVAKRREGTRLPGCLSPVGTAMDASNVAKSGAEPRGSVFPAIVHRFRASIVSSHRAVSRNARGEAPSPASFYGREGRSEANPLKISIPAAP